LNKSELTEYVKAERYSVPFKVWEFTALDRACLRMVIRETWIFSNVILFPEWNYFTDQSII